MPRWCASAGILCGIVSRRHAPTSAHSRVPFVSRAGTVAVRIAFPAAPALGLALALARRGTIGAIELPTVHVGHRIPFLRPVAALAGVSKINSITRAAAFGGGGDIRDRRCVQHRLAAAVSGDVGLVRRQTTEQLAGEPNHVPDGALHSIWNERAAQQRAHS